MKVCGVVAEYNPFHNGHLYQLKEARKKTGADVLVVAMSGNFLQRGEPAIIDKWERAAVALKYGADIVVEIPAAFSVQPADLYAKGGIEILFHMGIEALSFGSESGNGSDFYQAASVFLDNEKKINELFQKEQKQKLTYARNMSDILLNHFPEIRLDLTQPNNMLGFAYAKELLKSQYPIEIETILRKNSHYHDSQVSTDNEIASATAIRNLLFTNHNWQQAEILPFPFETEEYLSTNKLVNWEDFFPYLKYRIMTTSLLDLSRIYLMEKGLEYRVKDVMKDAKNMSDFLSRLKTKQLSWTRLQRLSFYILLNQSELEMEKRVEEIEYIRLLGFNAVGQNYLSQIKHYLKKPLITNVNQKNNDLLAHDIMAGDVYRLADQERIEKQDYTRKPLKIN